MGYCCEHSFHQPVFLLIDRVFDLVINNNLLDCFVECFMIVCIHEVFTVDQMRDYLLLLFQSNTKLNKEEYILEVFTDWNEMNYQPNRKEELLKLFL